jgi:hypothetical protein
MNTYNQRDADHSQHARIHWLCCVTIVTLTAITSILAIMCRIRHILTGREGISHCDNREHWGFGRVFPVSNVAITVSLYGAGC